jgi:hypothetical protein
MLPISCHNWHTSNDFQLNQFAGCLPSREPDHELSLLSADHSGADQKVFRNFSRRQNKNDLGFKTVTTARNSENNYCNIK